MCRQRPSQREGFNNGYSAGSLAEYLRVVCMKDGRSTTITKREKDHEMKPRCPRDPLVHIFKVEFKRCVSGLKHAPEYCCVCQPHAKKTDSG
jgi:hypothetical protein